jgi:hypothetical protein
MACNSPVIERSQERSFLSDSRNGWPILVAVLELAPF